MLTFERKDLRRYSVWEQQEMNNLKLHFHGDEDPSPVAVLLFCVSETAAAAIQRDLCKLGIKQDRAMDAGEIPGRLLVYLKSAPQILILKCLIRHLGYVYSKSLACVFL